MALNLNLPHRLELVSLERFLQSPVGRCTASANSLIWMRDASLGGVTSWGRYGAEEAMRKLRMLKPLRHPRFTGKLTAFLDYRLVDDVDNSAVMVLTNHLMKEARSLALRVASVVMLVGYSPMGLMAAGMPALVHTSFPVHVVTSVEAAVPLLQTEGHADAGQVLRHVDHVVDMVRGTTPLLVKLRAWMSEQVPQASLQGAATALAVSARSLQRVLAEHRTSFQEEHVAARLGVAKRLLLNTDMKVESVARTAGFASASHLSRLFRRHTGETPTGFRARNARLQLVPPT